MINLSNLGLLHHYINSNIPPPPTHKRVIHYNEGLRTNLQDGEVIDLALPTNLVENQVGTA